MGIEWFRDLSIIVFALATTVVVIVVGILFIRLYRSAKWALTEFKVASILTRDTAEIMHDGVKPISSILGVLRAFRGGYEQSDTTAGKHRR